VSQERLERDGSLIAKSVALLSADVPLNVMLERMRDLLAGTFDARAAIALAGDAAAASSLPPPGQVVLEGGDAVLEDDALFVPIVERDRTAGVIGLLRTSGPPFTFDDRRTLEAVARYVAIAVRERRGFRPDAFAARNPWPLVALVLAAALMLTTALAFYAHARIEESRSNALALQDSRLRQTALVLEDYVGDSVHLADAVASVIGPMHENRQLAETALVHFFTSVDDPAIFGIGIYFEPHRFDPALRLYDPYVDRKISKISKLPYDFYPTAQSYDYLSKKWYLLGRSARHIAFTGPYFEDALTYLSAIRPFHRGSAFAGVVTVDSLPKHVVALLRSHLAPGDVAWVSGGGSAPVLSTGPVPPDAPGRNVLSTPIRWAPWTLHLSSDFTPVIAAGRAVAGSATAIGIGVWILSVLAIVMLVRARNQHVKTIGLELRHADLENEIAAHLDVEERLRESAFRDSLTGLPNRPFFLQTLEARLDERRAGRGAPFAVLFIDIDRFSVINDSLGHGAGDVFLRMIAERIAAALPPGTKIARLGGDEFVALLDLESDDPGAAVAGARGILDRLREPFSMNENELYSGASIGIVMSDARYSAPEELLRDADIAMYRAKKSGRGRCVVFDAIMHDRARELLVMESDLRRAVGRGEVIPYYQPIVGVRDGRLASMEALARWNRGGTIVSAAEFIDVAEQTGALAAIDAIVLASACRDARAMSVEYGRPFEVSVNVSATQLTRTDIVADIVAALKESALPSSSLKLEITETAIMENAEEALLVLGRLRELGLSVVVDDFGTGYSSLSYLRRLPISGLKIDRSFVNPVTTDPQADAIVRAIVALAKTLSLEVTAEGVETAEQLALLQDCGIDYAQGYYFSKAVPADGLRALVIAQENAGSLLPI